MMAAGTSAPMPMAAKATPANHDGNMAENNWGMASWALPPAGFTPAATAM